MKAETLIVKSRNCRHHIVDIFHWVVDSAYMASPGSTLCSFANVSDPLELYIPGGSSFYIPLSFIFTPEGRPISAYELQPTTSLVELRYTNGSTHGVLLHKKRRESILSLGQTALQSTFIHCSQLARGNSCINVLLAFLEQVVLREDYPALERLLQWSLGEHTLYYVQKVKAAMSLETLDGAIDTIQSQGSEKTIEQELVAVQGLFYKNQTGMLPYSQANDRQIDNQTWLFHALASIFEVIIDQIFIEGQGVRHKFYHPNSVSWLCPVVSLCGDMWLQARVVVSCGKQLKDFTLSTNLFAELKEMYDLRKAVKKMTNIGEMQVLRPMAVTLEARFATCTQGIERRKAELDEVTGLLYEQATTQQSMVSLIDSRTKCASNGCGKVATHFFECDYGICAECLDLQLQSKFLHCDHCGKVIQRLNSVWKMYPPLSLQEKAAAQASQAKLNCSKCNISLKTGTLPIPDKLKPRVYQLECWDSLCSRCLEGCVREGSGTCPTCHMYVDIHEEEVLKTTEQCAGCKQWKPLIREFPAVSCQNHRLCVQCVSSLRLLSNCRICNRSFTQEEQSILANFSALTCLRCKDPVRRAQLVSNENPQCECVFCSKCYALVQRNSTDLRTCPGCRQQQSGQKILLRAYMNILNSVQSADFEEFAECRKATEKRHANYTECQICYGPIVSELSKVCAGRCLHCFHDECLGEAVKQDLDTIIRQNLRRSPKCPGATCKEELSTMHLTGQRHLISAEMYDKYQFYAAMQTHKEFKCQCNTVDYIEKDLKHFPCAKCHLDQCVTCHMAWAADHDAKACQFYQIEQAIKERFPASPAECPACNGTGLAPAKAGETKQEPCSTCTFSQCPGCKLPYLKDDHCDHVVCQNPECKVAFCFPCACLRSPTMEHCNQWHRPQCPNYPKDVTPAQIAKIIKGEKKHAKCTECMRLGKRCDPPPDLARIRRFALAEY